MSRLHVICCICGKKCQALLVKAMLSMTSNLYSPGDHVFLERSVKYLTCIHYTPTVHIHFNRVFPLIILLLHFMLNNVMMNLPVHGQHMSNVCEGVVCNKLNILSYQSDGLTHNNLSNNLSMSCTREVKPSSLLFHRWKGTKMNAFQRCTVFTTSPELGATQRHQIFGRCLRRILYMFVVTSDLHSPESSIMQPNVPT